jgi:hypothetical protein
MGMRWLHWWHDEEGARTLAWQCEDESSVRCVPFLLWEVGVLFGSEILRQCGRQLQRMQEPLLRCPFVRAL